MKLPEIGNTLYIPGSYHISRGSDDIDGGLATISEVILSNHLPENHYNYIMVKFKELSQAHSYNYRYLLEKQEELKKDYEGQIAKPNPDIDTPWIESGDIVDGYIYQGPPII